MTSDAAWTTLAGQPREFEISAATQAALYGLYPPAAARTLPPAAAIPAQTTELPSKCGHPRFRLGVGRLHPSAGPEAFHPQRPTNQEIPRRGIPARSDSRKAVHQPRSQRHQRAPPFGTLRRGLGVPMHRPLSAGQTTCLRQNQTALPRRTGWMDKRT